MNASQLETATVTVQFVNPPKAAGKSGSIKDTDGQFFSVWPNMLPQFRPGGTYEIEFTAKQAESGIVYRDVKVARPVTPPAAVPVTPPPAAKPAAQSNNSNASQFYRPTAPRDAERMFVCSTLNAWIKTGRVEFTHDGLVDTVSALRNVWQNTFGQDDLP